MNAARLCYSSDKAFRLSLAFNRSMCVQLRKAQGRCMQRFAVRSAMAYAIEPGTQQSYETTQPLQQRGHT